MYYNQELGKLGEIEAENYLRKKGYKILDKNFRCKTRRNRHCSLRKR